MNKVSKILVAMAGTVLAAVVAVSPVKAGTLEEDQAWVKAQAEAGMKMAIAHQNEIAAAAEAGMKSGQAYLDAALKTMNVDQASLAAQAAAGLKMAQAHQDDIAAAAAAGLASGQAYLDAAAQTMNKDQAELARQAAAGMASGQAYLNQRAAEGKSGMVAGATEAVRVAKANLASVKDLAKANPQFAAQIPAAEAALAQAEAYLASLQ